MVGYFFMGTAIQCTIYENDIECYAIQVSSSDASDMDCPLQVGRQVCLGKQL
jgi:hypothetical protein